MPLSMLKLKLNVFRNTLVKERHELMQANVQKNKSALLVVCLIVLGIGYLGEINSLSTKGFALKALESRKSELQQQQKDLQVQLTEARATENIISKIDKLSMVPVYAVSYIKIGGGDVALAK